MLSPEVPGQPGEDSVTLSNCRLSRAHWGRHGTRACHTGSSTAVPRSAGRQTLVTQQRRLSQCPPGQGRSTRAPGKRLCANRSGVASHHSGNRRCYMSATQTRGSCRRLGPAEVAWSRVKTPLEQRMADSPSLRRSQVSWEKRISHLLSHRDRGSATSSYQTRGSARLIKAAGAAMLSPEVPGQPGEDSVPRKEAQPGSLKAAGWLPYGRLERSL